MNHEQESPDLRRAIAKALQSAAALVGEDHVVSWFGEKVGEIVSTRWPIDAGGLVAGKCKGDMAQIINQLLREP